MPEKPGGLPSSLRKRLYLPAYRTNEAAWLAQTTAQTVSRWYHGYQPVFHDHKEERVALSYLQLVETAFVASFRKFQISLQRVRRAHQYLSRMFQVQYPFAQLALKTDGVHILKDLEEHENGHKAKMIVADHFGQEAWPQVIAERFEQFVYEYDLALRWFPRGAAVPIVVDPRISFGAPIVQRAGIATWVLRERYEAGETLEELQDDFRVDENELRMALEFERVR